MFLVNYAKNLKVRKTLKLPKHAHSMRHVIKLMQEKGIPLKNENRDQILKQITIFENILTR